MEEVFYFLSSFFPNPEITWQHVRRAASMHHSLAISCYEEKYYEAALQHFNSALKMYIHFDKPPIGIPKNLIANCYQSMASCQRNLGFTKAADLSEQREKEVNEKSPRAKDMPMKLDTVLSNEWHQVKEIANTYCKLASFCFDETDYQKAKQYYNNALKIYLHFDKPDNNELKHSIANCNHDIADCYKKLNQFDTARHFYEKAISIYEKNPADSGMQVDLTRAYGDMSELSHLECDRENAIAYCQKALTQANPLLQFAQLEKEGRP